MEAVTQHATRNTQYPLAEDVWPTGGVPLVKEAVSPYFLPVTQEILGEIVRRIVAALDPERIILFGSYAGGVPNADSDVDLFVEMETDLPYADRCAQVSELIRPRPFPMDILVHTPAEMATYLSKGHYFFEEIFEQGRHLYERSKESPELGR